MTLKTPTEGWVKTISHRSNSTQPLDSPYF